jgi:peroxiredoxin
MTKRYKAVILGILVALFLPFAYPAAGNARDGLLREKAPDFTLKDLQGIKFTLSENKGKPVLLVFGATWCPYCISDIPRLKEIYADYGKRGLIMVNIDIQESLDKVSRFAKKYQLPYRVLLDETAEVAEKYGVQGVPTTVLLDKNGMIVCRQCRAVEPFLEKMLKKN